MTREEKIQVMEDLIRLTEKLTKLFQSELKEMKLDEKKFEVVEAPIQHEHKERTYEDVTKIIHMLGVTPNLKGYDYLREAVTINLKEGNIAITRQLYPTIARQYNTTPGRVERAIRHSISKIYKNGNDEIVLNVFGNTKNALTNSEAICMIAEYLRLHKL